MATALPTLSRPGPYRGQQLLLHQRIKRRVSVCLLVTSKRVKTTCGRAMHADVLCACVLSGCAPCVLSGCAPCVLSRCAVSPEQMYFVCPERMCCES